MTTPCYNTRCADEYAHQLGHEAEQQEAIEREIDSWLDKVPELFAELIRLQFYKDAQFAENSELVALRLIRERNLP